MMTKAFGLISGLSLTLLFGACAGTNPKRDFMLKEFSATDQLSYMDAQVVLLGEKHDNPFHHRIQAQVLEQLGREGRLKAVVFEQIDWSYQGILDQVDKDNFDDLEDKLEWKKSGWPDYDIYEPIFEVAVKYQAKLIAGGLPKERVKSLYANGYEAAFNAAEIEQMKLGQDLDAEGRRLLSEEIFEGHCKMIPEDHVGKMIPVQRARDAAMVRAYKREAPVDGVTAFILGAGHARKEFGVPVILGRMDPRLKMWSMGLVEENERQPPQSAFDRIWVTEKFDRPDPCESLKKTLQKKAGS